MKNHTSFRYGDRVKVIDGFYQGLTGTLRDYDENGDNFLIKLFKKYVSDENTASNMEDPEERFVCKAVIKSEDLRKINE